LALADSDHVESFSSNTTGDLQVQGPNVFRCYFNRPGKYKATTLEKSAFKLCNICIQRQQQKNSQMMDGSKQATLPALIMELSKF